MPQLPPEETHTSTDSFAARGYFPYDSPPDTRKPPAPMPERTGGIPPALPRVAPAPASASPVQRPGPSPAISPAATAGVPPRNTPVMMPPAPRSYTRPAPPKRKRGRGIGLLFFLIFCLLAGGFSGAFVAQMVINEWQANLPSLAADLLANQAPPPWLSDIQLPPAALPPTAAPVLADGSLRSEEIYQLGRQQVVGISSEIISTNIFGQASTQRVSGTGFILSEDGYILTNQHVIENATRIFVILEDGRMHEARLVGAEGRTSDIAVLHIPVTGLTPATIGQSDNLPVGSRIYAIGHPLGELSYTITQGIVSALNREVAIAPGRTIHMFQIDAAVNSGNSGGPIFNAFGEVVGVVTAKSSLDGVEGIGFAIPIDDAMAYAQAFITGASTTTPHRAHLGVFSATITPEYAALFDTVVGAFVNAVYEGSAAELAGIQERDIITNFGGIEIESVDDLQEALGRHTPGDQVLVRVFRQGEHLLINVILG